ncbi:MAG: SMC-Scp complex subunit ScpB [Candidatus Nanohaloarchaeota archaeon QJJ-9]|nr:SMC-Scp complex subunit ScpB [Candidatus Nanohaloarchaeota archaeon QJJ-9]
MEEKKAVLESALFVADQPLDTDQIADLLNLGSKGFVQQVVDDLKEDLEEDKHGLEIMEVEDGYRMQVKQDYVSQVKHLAPHQDLSDATLRTLSLIAYNAPVKQSRIIEIRGNRAYRHIKELESRSLVSSKKDGRTKTLEVTDTFLDYFGLESLDEFRRNVEVEEEDIKESEAMQEE